MSRPLRYGVVIAIGLIIRLALLPGKGFPTDISAFEDWAIALATVGPHELYADITDKVFPTVDYPPAYAYVLWLIGIVTTHLCSCTNDSAPIFKIAIKLPAVLADFALAGLIARIASRYASERTVFFTFAAIVLAPPLWLVSAYWGQVDSVAALLALGAIALAIERRFTLSWVLLAIALMTKPQALVALPALLVWELRERGVTLGLLWSALAGCALAYLVALPFAPVIDPMGVLGWIVARYGVGVGKYANGSTGAFNIYGIGNYFYSSDAQRFAGVPLHAWGIGLVLVSLAAFAAMLWIELGRAGDERQRERALLFAIFLSLAALFMLATRMHERYLMPALAVGAIVAAFDRRAAIAEGIFATTFTINCAFILVGFAGGKHHPIALYAGHAFAFINVATFFALASQYFRDGVRPARALAIPVASST